MVAVPRARAAARQPEAAVLIKHPRQFRYPDGLRTLLVDECRCGMWRSGPAGGVCMACYGAIPEANVSPRRPS